MGTNVKTKVSVKETLAGFVKLMDEKIDRYWQEEVDIRFGFNKKQKELVGKMLLHAREHSLRKAKRIRGAFVYYGYVLGNKKINEAIFKAAAGVELVHTSLLMHDDFMDQDNVRRGGPTTHIYFGEEDLHYGESMAVDLGDAVLEIGQEWLLDAGFEAEVSNKALIKMLRGITNTAWGQAFDLSLEKMRDSWEEDDVITVHKAKTAIYTYENPLFIGAILAGLEGRVFDVLHDYSMNGGVAFQLQDDILGVFGDTEKTGKSANSDLLGGKATLLVMKAFKDGTKQQKEDLERVWGKRRATDEDIGKAKKAIIESGSLEYSRIVSRKFAQKAVDCAEQLRSMKLNSEAIDFISGIAEYMVNREV